MIRASNPTDTEVTMNPEDNYLRHGDPCTRCPKARPDQPIRAATHYGMCQLCWLGASETQRRDAIFDATYINDIEPSTTTWTLAMMQTVELELLFNLPDAKPNATINHPKRQRLPRWPRHRPAPPPA